LGSLAPWLLGSDPPPKVTYNVWIWKMAHYCKQQDFSLSLLGGRPGSKLTLPKTASRHAAGLEDAELLLPGGGMNRVLDHTGVS
jgi:hypothetical protein